MLQYREEQWGKKKEKVGSLEELYAWGCPGLKPPEAVWVSLFSRKGLAGPSGEGTDQQVLAPCAGC